jgi:diguanylate cyclase (GGDEF)-like protein
MYLMPFNTLNCDTPIACYVSDHADHLTEASNGLCALLGYSRVEIKKLKVSDLSYQQECTSFQKAKKIAVTGKTTSFDYLYRKSDGSILHTYNILTISPNQRTSIPSDSYHYLCFVINQTEFIKENEKLKILAYRDSLTNLYNNLYFESLLRESLTENRLPCSLIVCDINGLKLINDIYGKDTGDQVIRSIAQTILEITRSSDIVIRTGGDEFFICLPQTDKKIAGALCDQIRAKAAISQGHPLPDGLVLSVSTGVTTLSSLKDSYSKGFQEAETLMNKYKLLETRSMRSSTVSVMLRTLQEKNIETGDHFDRMKNHCLNIGHHLGLPASMLADLALLAVFHDIGKIAISDNIINKNAKLTRQEKDEIKKHSEYGYRITQAAVEFQHLSEYILTHHEKWDGTGYPGRLKGENIPLLSRILAIVDSYDAMTHVRPYREALSEKEAIAEIINCAGSQFDPRIAKVFVEKVLGSSWESNSATP